MLDLLIPSFFETLFMVCVASIFGFVCGVPIALCLWKSSPHGIKPRPLMHKLLSLFINASRSIPYIIFMVLMIPLTRMLVGSSIGTLGATVPLTLASILLYTRFAEEAFYSIPKGMIEAGQVMAARNSQIIRKIVLSEAMPQLIAHLTTLVIMIIGFSAMAGAVGGGGLGDLAIRYGYQRYDILFLSVIVCVLIIMVQCVQMTGDWIVRKLRK